MNPSERQITRGPGGRILTNTGVWSPDGAWIVYDVRSDPAGERFDGDRIEQVHADTGRVQTLYQAQQGARCGVVTHHPSEPRVAFILGPQNPTPDWQYSAFHRHGLIVDTSRPGTGMPFDARDLVPPFTPGALRGGSHVHVWDPRGDWISFTYEDALLAGFTDDTPEHDANLRNVGVGAPGRPVRVSRDHPRNHDGEYFCVLATRTTANPAPGSDDILRACEEGWIGTEGYVRPDGTRQRRALAFQGHVVTPRGQTIAEVYLVDLPEDLSIPGDGPLPGTATRRPAPPKGARQRRLTRTADRPHPGIQGPRHWLRASPDGTRIAFLMKDDAGVVQVWTVSPNGGSPVQVTHNPHPIASTFTWSPDGRWLAHVMDRSVCVTDASSGETRRLTPRCDEPESPRPEACVFSPDGRRIAFIRHRASDGTAANQICVVDWAPPTPVPRSVP
ncbi:MAG TPA: DUF3748 domain-containing protein [Verrucomicrobiota bacterium]|nr:DUF3748 domain-containing protein [Verrucomicrobiota bacterium]HNU51659.1 DUF3748 domain-containing protein [Verrucomicrobiota bacterium]